MNVDYESLWTANDVAAYLKTSRSWVYQQSSSGLLPCVHVGGLLRFMPAAIRAWVTAQNSGARVIALAGR